MKKISAFAAIAALFMSSCQKEASETNSQSPQINNFSELKAPYGFGFNASKTVTLDISVNNPGYQQAHSIEVYDSNPLAGGELIYRGFTENDQLNAEISVASLVKQLYVVKKNPTGSSVTKALPVNGNNVNYAFGKKSLTKKTVVVSPTCNSGCNYSYNDLSSNLNINGNDPAGVYCFTGSTTANINVNRSGVTLRICGTAIVQNINLNNAAKLEITDGASLRVNNLGMNSNANELTVYTTGSLEMTSNMNTNGTIINHGTITVTRNLNLNGQSVFTNNGALTVGIDLNQNKTLTNNGSIEVGDDLHLNGSSVTTNNCKIIMDDDIHVNSTITNSGFMHAEDQLIINGGSNFTLHDGAMIEANRATFNNTITGTGSNTSLVKLFDSQVFGNSLKTIINGSGGFTGSIEFCDPDGIETNNNSSNSFANGAAQGCSLFIATSSCNPSGNGVPTVADDDNDNVSNDNDQFPNDPLRAGEVVYPGANTFGTIAFEDLWPAMGDYDFNDLVLDYRAHWITDANNKVKDITIEYRVRAIGAGLKNGFGLQLNVAPSAVESVTRSTALSNLISLNANGTEANQSKAVIILFDDANDELPNPGSAFVNTVNGSPYSTPKVSQITVTFGSPQTLNQVMEMNAFMIVGQVRNKEIHMAGYPPTDLGSTSLFGTAADDSDPSTDRYYVNKNNLPWVINVPVSFDYPSEKNDVVQSYSSFASWVLSGGSTNNDWFTDLSGYRNASLIY